MSDEENPLSKEDEKAGDVSGERLGDSDLQLNNNADEDASVPTSPLPRYLNKDMIAHSQYDAYDTCRISSLLICMLLRLHHTRIGLDG